jgi:hypothetical protein
MRGALTGTGVVKMLIHKIEYEKSKSVLGK